MKTYRAGVSTSIFNLLVKGDIFLLNASLAMEILNFIYLCNNHLLLKHFQGFLKWSSSFSSLLLTIISNDSKLAMDPQNMQVSREAKSVMNLWNVQFWDTNSMVYGTRRINAPFTRAPQQSLSSAESTQFLVLIPIYLRSILIWSSHLRLGLSKALSCSRTC